MRECIGAASMVRCTGRTLSVARMVRLRGRCRVEGHRNVGSGLIQIIDDNFCRTKHFTAPAITALANLEYDVVRSPGVATGRYGLPMRVKYLAKTVLWLNAVASQELLKLVKCHLDALEKLFMRGGPVLAGECAFKIVNRGQQFLDERFLLSNSSLLSLPGGSSSEILEIRGQA